MAGMPVDPDTLHVAFKYEKEILMNRNSRFAALVRTCGRACALVLSACISVLTSLG